MTNSQSRIPKFLQRLFLVLEVLAVAVTSGFIVLLLVVGAKFSDTAPVTNPLEGNSWDLSLSVVGIRFLPEFYHIQVEGIQNASLQLKNVHGSIVTSDPRVGRAFLKEVTAPLFLFILSTGCVTTRVDAKSIPTGRSGGIFHR